MNHPNRRQILQAGATLGASAFLPLGCAEGAQSLQSLARRKGITFGTGIERAEMDSPALTELVLKECAIVTPRNALKWRTLRPTPEVWDFTGADAVAKFAADNNLQMRGHVLVWNPVENIPEWTLSMMTGSAGRAPAIQLMEEHIEKVCSHFGQQITSWDVVNEAFEPYSGTFGPGFFRDRIGPDYIEIAFRKAREAAPHAQLVYNDYMRWSEKHSNHHLGVLKLLEDLRNRNVPVDALGIQGHIGKYPGTENDAHWRKFLDEVTAMGYDLLITEFDVRDFDPAPDIATRDAEVAALAKAFLDITLSYKELRHFLCWQMSDAQSWFRQSEPREDGELQRNAPFDTDLKPKPLYDAIAAALKAAPARSATA